MFSLLFVALANFFIVIVIVIVVDVVLNVGGQPEAVTALPATTEPPQRRVRIRRAECLADRRHR